MTHYYKKEYLELVRNCFDKLLEISKKTIPAKLEKGDTVTFSGEDFGYDFDVVVKKHE